MFSGLSGIIHFIASLFALATGTWILSNLKGTSIHKTVGYVYFISMLIVCITSFMQYRLHGHFGFLHWMAVISTVSLLGGMIPIILKRPKNHIVFHFSFMYWSIIGLYCAFAAEIFTRIPLLIDFEQDMISVFYFLVILATVLVGGIGAFFFRKLKHKWADEFHI